MMRWRRAGVVLGLALALGGAGAQRGAIAEETEPGDPELVRRKNEAKGRFLRGIELAGEQRWDAALAEFVASRELFPTRVALRNGAVCLRNLRRFADALEMNAAMLRDFGSQMPPAERQQVETAMAELRANVGEIDVLTALGGGMVVIDGQQRGTTPLPAAILVDAGTHSVRVSKEGYETFEAEVRVAARQRRSVQAALQALRKGGTLIVKEAEGRALDVIVDGAVVGRTPWQGTVGVGRHHVSLGGKGELGTPPSAADVREGQTTTLALQAAALDAELRIEPSPSSAQVDVDGVNVGAGIWQGRLASGEHRIEIYAAGHVPDRRNVVLTQSRQELRVTLERDLSNPMWKIGFLPHLYLEATVAGAFAPSFGGSADARCDQGDCSHRSRPLGVLAGARAGYRLNGGLGLELFAGYAYLKETVTRRAGATWDSTTDLVSTDYRDSTTLSGPLAALSASYQVLERTPLTFRIWLGMARARARSTNRGTFSGPVGSGFDTQEVSIPETPADLWLPMVGPEVRFGYRLRRRWLIDVGLAVLWAFPPDIERVGGLGLVGVESRVAAPVSGRSLQLEREKSLGTFVTFFPSAAVSFDLYPRRFADAGAARRRLGGKTSSARAASQAAGRDPATAQPHPESLGSEPVGDTHALVSGWQL